MSAQLAEMPMGQIVDRRLAVVVRTCCSCLEGGAAASYVRTAADKCPSCDENNQIDASWSLNATTNCLRTHGPWTEMSLAVPAPVFKAVVW